MLVLPNLHGRYFNFPARKEEWTPWGYLIFRHKTTWKATFTNPPQTLASSGELTSGFRPSVKISYPAARQRKINNQWCCKDGERCRPVTYLGMSVVDILCICRKVWSNEWCHDGVVLEKPTDTAYRRHVLLVIEILFVSQHLRWTICCVAEVHIVAS